METRLINSNNGHWSIKVHAVAFAKYHTETNNQNIYNTSFNTSTGDKFCGFLLCKAWESLPY